MRIVATLVLCAATWAAAEETEEPATLPVREVSVFKDGYAVVVCEGALPVDSAGDIVLDALPKPVLGTFWPYSAEATMPLQSATAGRRPVPDERKAASLFDILEMNTGARITVTENSSMMYTAVLREFRPPGNDARGYAVLDTGAGHRVVPAEQIRDVTFPEAPKSSVPREDAVEDRLILRLGLPANPPAEARVGLLYVEKGLRWIPEYRVELRDDGTAHLKLQAVLVNDLVDLEDAVVNLVVGVPSFLFKDRLDPMSLQEAVAQVAAAMPAQNFSNWDNSLSNAIMTQVAVPVAPQAPQDPFADLQSSAEAGRSEDLYVFTIPRVTLRKGERLSVPVAEFDLPYESLYRLDMPAGVPPEVRQAVGPERPEPLFAAPKVMHVVRLTNATQAPLTTAPALILRGGRVLAQSLMTYTPAGAKGDLDLTTAVDIQVLHDERETSRTPDATFFGRESYQRVDVEGAVRVANYRQEPVALEVVRYVAGHADSAGADGRISQLNVYGGSGLPGWWQQTLWPHWWYNLNGIARIAWTVNLNPGQSIELPYAWHYFWK